jgi:hypothetical protein
MLGKISPLRRPQSSLALNSAKLATVFKNLLFKAGFLSIDKNPALNKPKPL